MREIKFRAKVKWNGNHYEAGQWVYGYYAYFDGKHQIYDCGENYASGIGDFTRYAWVEIDETSLSEYTGLKDKNGVEIYEGGIVGLIHEKHGLINSKVIIWDKDNACFDWENTNGDSWPDGFTGFIDEYEVIGTIYENPELLDAK